MKKQIVVFCIFAMVATTGMVFAQEEKEKEFSLKTIQIGMVVHDLDTSLKFYKDIYTCIRGLHVPLKPISAMMVSVVFFCLTRQIACRFNIKQRLFRSNKSK
ncbi:MAG: hypothetical protein ACLFPI_06900 [Desulfobacterales bacterium]